MDVVFNQGARENLPSAITGGNLYFCTNGETFLDINNETRIQLNPPETLATQEKNGLLSKEDKIKIDNLDNLETTKAAKFVIGSSSAGYTAQTCDYLCDGTADDVEINAAITALPENGGEIKILDGTYNITNSIIVDKMNVTISGNGNNTILKRMWDSTQEEEGIIYLSKGRAIIENLFLDGNKTIYTNNNNSCILLKNCSLSIIQNVYITNSIYGLSKTKYTASLRNMIINNIFFNCDKPIYLNASISLTTISNNRINGGTCAIDLQYSNNNNIINNTIAAFTEKGINLISSGKNNISNNNIVRDNYTDGQYSIFVYGPESTENIISNNLILGKDIEIQGATGNSVYGNKWKQDSAGVITSTTSEPGPAVQINADTLGGKPASNYVTNDILESKNYATIEYVDGQVDTINSEISGKAKRYIYNSTLSTTWLGSTAPYTQTVSIADILASDTPHITPVFSTTNTTAKSQKEAWGLVSKAVTNNGNITFTCFEEKPTTAIDLQIEVIR